MSACAQRLLGANVLLTLLAALLTWGSPAAAQTPVDTVRMVDIPIQDWLPLWLIQDRDLGRPHGIRLESISVTGGTQVGEMVVTGNADIANLAITLGLLMIKQGVVPAKAVLLSPAGDSADPKHPLAGVVVSGAIKTWKDLEGKTVATHNFRSLLFMALKKRLRLEGVDPAKVNFVEIPLPQQEAALRAGRVQAISPGSEFVTRAVVNGTGRLHAWYVGEPPFNNYGVAVLAANRAWYENKPAVVERFMRTYLLAVDWIVKNPEESKLFLTKKLGITQPEAIKQFSLLRWDPGLRLLDSVKLDVEMLKEEGLLTEPISLEKFLVATPLVDKLRRELGIK